MQNYNKKIKTKYSLVFQEILTLHTIETVLMIEGLDVLEQSHFCLDVHVHDSNRACGRFHVQLFQPAKQFKNYFQYIIIRYISYI